MSIPLENEDFQAKEAGIKYSRKGSESKYLSKKEKTVGESPRKKTSKINIKKKK